jgi:hypothetical protein
MDGPLAGHLSPEHPSGMGSTRLAPTLRSRAGQTETGPPGPLEGADPLL